MIFLLSDGCGILDQFCGHRTDEDCAPPTALDEMEHWKRMNRGIETALRLKEERSGVGYLISGSRAEGLRLETAVSELRSDLDTMVILPSRTTCDTDGHMWTLDTQSAPPGYTCIKRTGQMDDSFVTSNLHYWLDHLHSKYGLVFGEVDMHGPAQRTQCDGLQLDFVPTLVFDAKLPGISTWSERQRRCNWPPENMIKHIQSLPTLAVPVGHHGSLEPQKEWRISYSQAEMELCRTISDVARTGYTRFKNLVKNELYHNGLSGITSYQLKTTLLWVLEEHGNAYDQEDEVVTKLMNKLLGYLQKGHLPQYFNPNINLIDTLDKDSISGMIQTLSSLRIENSALTIKNIYAYVYLYFVNICVFIANGIVESENQIRKFRCMLADFLEKIFVSPYFNTNISLIVTLDEASFTDMTQILTDFRIENSALPINICVHFVNIWLIIANGIIELAKRLSSKSDQQICMCADFLQKRSLSQILNTNINLLNTLDEASISDVTRKLSRLLSSRRSIQTVKNPKNYSDQGNQIMQKYTRKECRSAVPLTNRLFYECNALPANNSICISMFVYILNNYIFIAIRIAEFASRLFYELMYNTYSLLIQCSALARNKYMCICIFCKYLYISYQTIDLCMCLSMCH